MSFFQQPEHTYQIAVKAKVLKKRRTATVGNETRSYIQAHHPVFGRTESDQTG